MRTSRVEAVKIFRNVQPQPERGIQLNVVCFTLKSYRKGFRIKDVGSKLRVLENNILNAQHLSNLRGVVISDGIPEIAFFLVQILHGGERDSEVHAHVRGVAIEGPLRDARFALIWISVLSKRGPVACHSISEHQVVFYAGLLVSGQGEACNDEVTLLTDKR